MQLHLDGPGNPSDFLRSALLRDGATPISDACISVEGFGRLEHLEVFLLSGRSIEDDQAPWRACWIVPETEEAARLINAFLNDDITAILTLSDGRSSAFLEVYDGFTLRMQGLAPFG